MRSRFPRLVATIAAATMLAGALPAPAMARMVSTEEVIASERAAPGADHVRGDDGAHAALRALLARDDVRAGLERRGVDAAAARARVDALTDDEARELAGRIDSLPAGGDVIGVLFTIFIILLVTDILGLTKVFPFTRSARR